MRTKSDVNGKHIQAARARLEQNGDQEPLPDSLLLPADAETFPYLEQVMAATQKHPYAALGVMIGIATLIVGCLVTVSVSVFMGMFLMYGTMRETTANQVQIQTALVAIQKQQTDDANAIRAYESNRARRTEFIVGLMSPDRQQAVARWDKANPAPELPTPRKE